MTKRTKRTFALVGFAIGALTAAALALLVTLGVRASAHPTEAARLGRPGSSSQLEALVDLPGPIVVETIAAADWQVSRSGLIDLTHPTAKAEGLTDGPEPIQIYLHVLRHPDKGSFLIDTGVERALRDDPKHATVRGIVAAGMQLETLVVRRDAASVVAAEGRALSGVLLTHLHLDHITGMPDIPRGTPLYAGPGETTQRTFLNVFTRATTDAELEGHRPIGEWAFTPDPDGVLDGVIDVLGDGSLFAIWVPGHTAGSTAYVARTPEGSVLFTGDTCHTAWGWAHGVPPGDFTADRARNAASLGKLDAFVKRHPTVSVRLGHQPLSS